jgi:hypothetical protein
MRSQRGLLATAALVAAALLPTSSRADCNARRGGAFLDALQRRVERFCLASDLFWGLWARAQARISLIDFDFAGYSARRLAAYDARKAELFPRAPRLAPPRPCGCQLIRAGPTRLRAALQSPVRCG